MRAICIALAALAAAHSLRAAELEKLLEEPAFWKSDIPTIVGKTPDIKFAWVSSDRTAARTDRGHTFLDMITVETLIELDHGVPGQVEVMLYNRGDSGDFSREQFALTVSNAQQAISAWAGTRPVVLADQLKTMGVRRDGQLWKKPPMDVRLLWSYSTKDADGRLTFRPEYVKVRIAPEGVRATATAAAAGPVSASGLKARIRKDASGDVVLTGVPMVDQGEKGYCAVASAERVMRFYGMDVDQHELAQLASSSAEGGTDPRSMLESLRRIGVKIGCKVRVIEEFSFQEFMRLVDRYNQAAHKRKLAEIRTGNVVDITEVYEAMDFAVLREVRLKSSANVRGFLDTCSRSIEQGMPLLWGVQLGKVKETPDLEQSRGGHMRLIIGYNPKTSQILYTDSWGPGHELKRMNLDDAWSILTALYIIEPRRTTL